MAVQSAWIAPPNFIEPKDFMTIYNIIVQPNPAGFQAPDNKMFNLPKTGFYKNPLLK